MINLIVVEAHHHVIEHIHYILRQRARKIKDGSRLAWSMLHWDSHPDLACPNEDIPALACFLPRKTWSREKKNLVKNEWSTIKHVEEKNLYDLLDSSEGGIAEWVLPLVLAGGLNRVIWMKNSWCSQFSNGRHYFHVGVAIPDGRETKVETYLDLPESATVKSSFLHPYYLDDKSFERLENLHLTQQLELVVLETKDVSTEDLSECTQQDLDNQTDWILDVCLDYFVCSNPFIDELNEMNAVVGQNLILALTQTNFRKEIHKDVILNEQQATTYSKCLHEFNFAVHSLLNKLVTPDKDYTKGLDVVAVEHEISILQEYYGDSTTGRRYWMNVIKSLDEVCRINPSSIQPLILIMSRAAQNISLPYLTDDIRRDQVAFPQNLQEKVQVFGDCLRQETWLRKEFNLNERPLLITIARSSDDGYTPNWVVETLQDAVVNQIHDVFCGCLCQQSEECKICLTLDYGSSEGTSLERLMF